MVSNLISWLPCAYHGFNGWFLNVKVVVAISTMQWEGPIKCEVIVKLREGLLSVSSSSIYLSTDSFCHLILWHCSGSGGSQASGGQRYSTSYNYNQGTSNTYTAGKK